MAFWIVKEYREAYNMYCCSGILFNMNRNVYHGETFVTRKITLAKPALHRGNRRSCIWVTWTHCTRLGLCQSYVECMWLILRHETPEDFVIITDCTAQCTCDFCYLAFKYAGIELRFQGWKIIMGLHIRLPASAW